VRSIGRVDTSPRQASLVATPHELAQTWNDLTKSGRATFPEAAGFRARGIRVARGLSTHESAHEYAFSGNERNGALTYRFRLADEAWPRLSTRRFTSGSAKVHSQFEQQTPQVQGEGQNSLFGVDVSAVLATATATVLEVDSTNSRVRLTSAGQAFGNRKGAQFAIYPPAHRLCAPPTAKRSPLSPR
jgi:hypothetical protein